MRILLLMIISTILAAADLPYVRITYDLTEKVVVMDGWYDEETHWFFDARFMKPEQVPFCGPLAPERITKVKVAKKAPDKMADWMHKVLNEWKAARKTP